MVTRALGDGALRHIGIIPDPETVGVGLGPDHVGFVLATDGLWDVVSEPDAAAACREEDAQRAAERLVRLVTARGGRDNVTVIVGRFRGPSAGSIDSTAPID
jgi:serine/threonine protein phosphatase PrpC